MTEDQSKVKPSRGNYHVVYKDASSIKTEEFCAKREMYKFLKDISKSAIVEIFKGRRLAIHVKEVYLVD